MLSARLVKSREIGDAFDALGDRRDRYDGVARVTVRALEFRALARVAAWRPAHVPLKAVLKVLAEP
jgi:hypothetical protein